MAETKLTERAWVVDEANDMFYIRPRGTGWLTAIVRKDAFYARHAGDYVADAHLIVGLEAVGGGQALVINEGAIAAAQVAEGDGLAAGVDLEGGVDAGGGGVGDDDVVVGLAADGGAADGQRELAGLTEGRTDEDAPGGSLHWGDILPRIGEEDMRGRGWGRAQGS